MRKQVLYVDTQTWSILKKDYEAWMKYHLNEREEKKLGDQRFIYILKRCHNLKYLRLLQKYLNELYQFLMVDSSTEWKDLKKLSCGYYNLYDALGHTLFTAWFMDVLLEQPIIPFKGSRSDLISLLEKIAKEFDVKLSK